MVIGALNSPRYQPAGLLVSTPQAGAALLDGGDEVPAEPLVAWLVTDLQSELIAQIRRLARPLGLRPQVIPLVLDGVTITPWPVRHTSHPTFGYLIDRAGRRAAWAPEFVSFPAWAAGVDLLFADAAGWRRPIRFARAAGGHMAALTVAAEARRAGVRRLVFAHLGRPTIRALDADETPPFGEIGREGQKFNL